MDAVTAAGAAFVAEIAEAHRAKMPDGRKAFLMGLVGRGIARSRSPQMHESEAERLGLGCSYALIDFDHFGADDSELGSVLAAAEAHGFAGLNVTHPFKQAVLRHLSGTAAEAAAIGAVNTVVFRGGRRVGHNTDSWGFAESLRRSLPAASLERVVLFGAGGAGAAVGHALLDSGAQLLDIFDSDQARATELAGRLSRRFGRSVVPVDDPLTALRQASGAVNATPIGMDKYPGVPFDPENLTQSQWVADIVYFPAETELLRRAAAHGCRTMDGTGMAVLQAVKAFEHFTGQVPDPDAMARHFEAAP